MAKKQQIILTHGSTVPASSAMTLGEVLVQHAINPEDAALHTVLNDGLTPVAFPSKEWVAAEIEKVNADGINDTLESLQEQIDKMDTAYKKADSDLDKAYKTADEAIISGYTAADAAITSAYTAADAALQGQVDALGTRIDTVVSEVAEDLQEVKKYADNKVKELADGAVATNTANIARIDGAADVDGSFRKAVADEKSRAELAEQALQAAIDTKVAQSAYDTKMGELDGSIATIESVIKGYEGEGSIKTAVDSKVAQSAYDTKMSELDSSIEGLENAISKLDDDYVTDTAFGEEVERIDADIAKAKTTITEASGVTAGVKIVKSQGEDGHDNYAITAVGLATESNLNTLADRVGVLEGDDAGKSVRAVAIEEIAKVVAEAPEDFDTLKEIADWIGNDTTGAASMANDIKALKDVTKGYSGEGAISTAVEGVATRVGAIEEDYLTSANEEALEKLVTDEATARETADNAINAKIGEVAEGKTVVGLIGEEKTAREQAILGVQEQINALDATYVKDTDLETQVGELNTNIAKAKTTITEASGVTEGVKIVKSQGEDDHDNYEITAVGLATSNVVTGIDTRLIAAEADIDALQAASATHATKTELSDAVSALETADSEMEAHLNAESAKKATLDSLNAVDGRLSTVEGAYVKTIKYKKLDGTYEELNAVNNVIDLSGMVIDGGTY